MGEIIIGIISGIVAALGMGGGTILILLLEIFSNLEQHIIQGTNLIFFIPTSIVAIIMNMKHKTINYKNATIVIVSGIIGAVLGCKISFRFQSKQLKRIFGIFLFAIAILQIYEICTSYRKKSKSK